MSTLLDDQCRDWYYLTKVVVPWIKEQKNPDVLRHIVLRTQSEELVRYIATAATVVDPALMNAALETCPRSFVNFANNDGLSRELYEHLLNRIVNAVSQEEDDPMLGHHLTHAYQELSPHGVNLRPDHIEHLAGVFEKLVGESDNIKEQICNRVLALLTEHAHATGNEEIALRVIDMAGEIDDQYWIRMLFYNSDSKLEITPRIAHAILAHCRNVSVLTTLAERPTIRQNPEIRRHLMESSEPAIILELARDRRPEEFRMFFQRLASTYAKAALASLTANRGIAHRTLSRTDLLPLLQTTSAEVRLGAIAFLSELQDDPEAKPSLTQQHKIY